MLQNIIDDIHGIEARLNLIAPMGYTLALNIRYFTPEFYLSTYPDEWVRIYTERRYALFDPVTVWCRFNEGKIRWSEIDIGVLSKVGSHIMEHARTFNLLYGGSSAWLPLSGGGIKSVLCGARSDREMTDEELAELADILNLVSEAVGTNAGLSAVELEALRDLAVGLTHNEIADQRRVSPATIKKRLERARLVLGARNSVHAVAIATRRGLILTDPTF